MEKNIPQEELEALHRLISNTMSEAIGVMERAGAVMLEIKKSPKHVSYLTKLRMDVLHQKNRLKEAYDYMQKVRKK